MKLKVTQSNLNRALGVVSRVAASRTTLPILSNILIKAEKNSLTVSATNLEIGITCTVAGKVDEQGSITIPARLMTDFVSNLPDENIDLWLEGHALHIKSGKYASSINGIPADDFPTLPAVENSSTNTLPATDLKKALQQTVLAASSDEARQVLTAVYTHTHENRLYIVATDSYRLAERALAENKDDFGLLVPATTYSELLRVIDDSAQEVSYAYDDSQVMFKYGDVKIISRLIAGNYPDYRQLIPRTGDVEFSVSRDDFINITKVSSLFAKESAGSITLDVDEDKQEVSIRSIASQVGENTSRADAKVKGSGNVTLNSRYLLDALNAFSGDTITFTFRSTTSPCVLKSADKKDSDYLHVVMPLRS